MDPIRIKLIELQDRLARVEAHVAELEKRNSQTEIMSSLHDLSVKLQLAKDQIMATLNDVQAAVTAEDTVIDSAIALLQGLAAQIAALQPNQAAIDALAADVTGKTQALADAVAANTPAAP